MSSPHDALFKYVFSQPEHAASELRAVLPVAVSARLDWGSLELQPASFVDERLSAREADLLFAVRCEGHSAQAPSGVEALSALLEYAFRVGDVLPEQLRELALQLGPAAQEAYMTAAQILIAEGEARGEARGEAKGKAELLLRQLGLRFGTLSLAIRDQVLHAPSDRLDVWAERVITAQSLEEVLS